MATAVRDDMFTPDVIADPYGYYGRLRDEDPVHWNDTYALWVVTRHDDLVWLTRHHELFSSAVFKNDPRPPYPAIDEFGSRPLRLCPELPGRPVHPARPPGASRDAPGRPWLLHAQVDGSLAPVCPEGGQGAARRGRGEGAHGRHAGSGDPAAGAGHRPDDGGARSRIGPMSESSPKSCSTSAAASTTA